MNTVNAVFFRRMTDDWKFQYQVFRMAVDWTIALYIVAPLILIGAYHYYTWWQITPDWLLNIPFGWALIPLFLYAWTGSLRLFFLEADLLFFIHDRRWSQGLIRRGTAYSLLLHLFWTLVAFFLVAPFFSYSLFAFSLFIWTSVFICLYDEGKSIHSEANRRRYFLWWTGTHFFLSAPSCWKWYALFFQYGYADERGPLFNSRVGSFGPCFDFSYLDPVAS